MMDGVLRGLRDTRLPGVIVCVLAAGALATGATAAAQDEKYLTEYRAFRAALDAGDRARAKVHAESAWQAAEAALGDDPQTATLAYNYSRRVLFDDADRARHALRRVIRPVAGISSPRSRSRSTDAVFHALTGRIVRRSARWRRISALRSPTPASRSGQRHARQRNPA